MSDALYELTAAVAIVALPCAAVGWLWRRVRAARA
jgi:hypothetical protein